MNKLGLILVASTLISAQLLTGEESSSLRGRLVRLCDDGLEWPPYTYFNRSDSTDKAEIVGFAVDVATEVFAAHNIRLQVELMPWSRCLREVENGQRIDGLLNASYSPKRAKNYLMSHPYYYTTPCYFYAKRHHPDGLDIKGQDDLKQ